MSRLPTSRPTSDDVGPFKEQPAVIDGELRTRPTVTLRFTYDERVEDGLYARRSLEILRKLVEDPATAMD